MSWENILKRPMNPNLRSKRDKQYRQAIVDYDRDVISPAYEKAIQNQPALENEKLTIFFTDEYEDEPVKIRNYGIGRNALARLGGNKDFIIGVLNTLYREAGYNTTVSGKTLIFTQK